MIGARLQDKEAESRLFYPAFGSAHLVWYAQSNIFLKSNRKSIDMGLLLDFLDSVLPGPEEASLPIQQKYTTI
jgi:hypothetical protein